MEVGPVVPAGTARCLQLADGRTVGYRVHQGAGPALVLVHGAGSSMASWDPVLVHLLAAGRTVVAVDLPGHGTSCASPGAYHPQSTVEAIAAVVAREELGPVHLVGHSLGGALVVGVAELLGSQCVSVCLVAAGGLGRSAALPLRAASLPAAGPALALAFAPGVVAALTRAGRALASVGVRTPLDADGLGSLAWLGDASRRAAFLATLRQVVGLSGQRMSTLARLAQAPGNRFLLVWGSADPILPVGHALRARAVLPGSTLHVFPGAGHEPHAHDARRFARVLLDHAASTERAAGLGER